MSQWCLWTRGRGEASSMAVGVGSDSGGRRLGGAAGAPSCPPLPTRDDIVGGRAGAAQHAIGAPRAVLCRNVKPHLRHAGAPVSGGSYIGCGHVQQRVHRNPPRQNHQRCQSSAESRSPFGLGQRSPNSWGIERMGEAGTGVRRSQGSAACPTRTACSPACLALPHMLLNLSWGPATAGKLFTETTLPTTLETPGGKPSNRASSMQQAQENGPGMHFGSIPCQMSARASNMGQAGAVSPPLMTPHALCLPEVRTCLEEASCCFSSV